MGLISFRRHSLVKASMVLTTADHLFIHTCIRSHLNIILRPIVMVHACVYTSYMTLRPTESNWQFYIYTYYKVLSMAVVPNLFSS